MSVTSTLKKQVDLPVWEWCRFAPVVSSLGLSLCSDETDGGRYIYYMGTTCYRYDTWTDGWQTIVAPNIPLLTVGASRYTVFGGFRGKVIAATSTTITLPGLYGQKLKNKKIRIYSGTGAGQERTISAISDVVVHESGLASTASVSLITDNQTIPKKWKINQWSGYSVRLVFGTGASQVRKILYNDTNTLTVTDPNWQPIDSWNNTGFSANAPYALPVTGSTHYFIESSVATVASWTTTPDATSRFVVLSGAVWFLTGRTLANGAAGLSYYDILTDTWINKCSPGGVFPILSGTDISLERTGEISGTFTTGTSTGSGDARNMINTGASWTVDQYANYQLRITNPATGIEQRRRIIGNTATIMYVDRPWDTNPTASYTYAVYGDTNAIWVQGNGQSSLYKYMIEEDLWTAGQDYDSGIARNLSYGKTGCKPFQATTAVNTAAMLTVNSSPTVQGTGYKVGDILNVTQGTGGKVRVTSITSTTGAVTGVEIYAHGTAGTYTTGTGKATTNAIPASGGGSGCTIEILTVGNIAIATCAIIHDFKAGDSVTHMGATVGAWNTAFTITAIDSLTTFYFVPPNTTAPAASYSNGSTLIVDSSKNWTVDEHKGKLITLYSAAGIVPTAQIKKISSNTATTITVTTITGATIGISRYVISDLNFFGRDYQYKVTGEDGEGWATGGTSGSLTDSTKTWTPGQWIGYKMKVICGTGFDKGEVAISDNTATQLTLTTPGFTPDATTKYRIMDTYGIATGTFAATTLADSTKNWAVNQWAGKSVRLLIPAALASIEVVIASNTATTLTYATTTTASDATTVYTILAAPVRSIGFQLMWNYGTTVTEEKGKYLYSPRGGATVSAGSNMLDRYIIPKDRWDIGILQAPASELEVLGSQWSYDGKDKIYWSPSGAAGATRIFAIDINTLEVDPAGMHPYNDGVAIQGNRMEIITTVDGLKYLYILRAAGSEFWRTLLWWQ